MDFFLGIFKKLQKVFKNTHEQMFHAVYIVQTAILPVFCDSKLAPVFQFKKN